MVVSLLMFGCGSAETGDTGPEAVDCDDYVGLASADALSVTPRNEGARSFEILALKAEGSFFASEDAYARVEADVTAAIAASADLAALFPVYWTDGRTIDLWNLDEATAAALENGALTATACADERYVREESYGDSDSASVAFQGIYDVELLAAEYVALIGGSARGVAQYRHGDGDRLCARLDGATWNYLFSHGWGDCAEGACGYRRWYWVTSDAAGAPVLEDDWGWTGSEFDSEVDPDPEPEWMRWEWSCG